MRSKTCGHLEWFLGLVAAALLCASCAGDARESGIPAIEPGLVKEASFKGGGEDALFRQIAPAEGSPQGDDAEVEDLLDQLAEIERTGGYVKGLGLIESGALERQGDYAGAVLAVFKELSWAKSYGGAGYEGIERAMEQVIAGCGDKPGALPAARAVLAFVKNDWKEAEKYLRECSPEKAEADAFIRWMLLVCALERGDASRQERSAYRAIRARYQLHHEYWYRGARAFNGAIAEEYAEVCIDLNPKGPFAEECRKIIAGALGLSSGAEAIRSKSEIDGIIKDAISSMNPQLLAELFPLISLPDNAYTLYALGALKTLTPRQEFRSFFEGEAASSRGRLAERLAYIAGGRG